MAVPYIFAGQTGTLLLSQLDADFAYVLAAGGGGGGAVTSFNSRIGAITLVGSDVTTALGFTPAGLDSPVFTGVPVVPTAAQGTNTTQASSTAFVQAAIAAGATTSYVTWDPSQAGNTAILTSSNHIAQTYLNGWVRSKTPLSSGIWYCELGSGSGSGWNGGAAVLLGIAKSTTDLNSSPLQAGTVWYSSFNGQKYIDGVATAYGATYTQGDRIGLLINLGTNSLTFYKNNVSQGTITIGAGPWIVAASSGDNVTLRLTQLYADPAEWLYAAPAGANAIPNTSSGVSSFNTRAGAVTLTSSDVTTALGFTPYNATNPSNYVAAASPALAGVPTAPTATPGTNTTQLATTAFVTAAIVGATSGVASFNTRTGAVTLTSADVNTALGYTAASTASPTFTGIPAGPTAAVGTSTTQLASTAFVTAALGPANIMAFGADATGATNCAPAVSAALTAGYTVLYFPKGTYKFTSAITTSGKNLTIYGDGAQTTRLVFTGAINGITFTGTMLDTQIHQLIVRDLALVAGDMSVLTAISAAWTAVGGDTFAGIARAAMVERVEITNNSVSSRWLTGIKLTDAPASLVLDCVFSQLAYSTSRDALGVYLTHVGGSGVIPTDTHVRGCAFSNLLTGMKIDGAQEGTHVIGCSFVGCNTGLVIDGTTKADGMGWVDISGCHFSFYQYGIDATDVFHLDIIDNDFLGLQKNAVVTLYGVRILSSVHISYDNRIAHNEFHLNDNTYTAMYPVYIDGTVSVQSVRTHVESNRFGGGFAWTKGAVFGANTTKLFYADTNLGSGGEVCQDLGTGNLAQAPLL